MRYFNSSSLYLVFSKWCAGRIFGPLRNIHHVRIDLTRIQMSVIMRYSPWPERLWRWCRQSLLLRSPQRRVVWGWLSCERVSASSAALPCWFFVPIWSCSTQNMTPFSADTELKRQWRSSPSTTLLLVHEDSFLSLIRITLLSGGGRGRFHVRTAWLVPNGSVVANHNLTAFGPSRMVVHKRRWSATQNIDCPLSEVCAVIRGLWLSKIINNFKVNSKILSSRKVSTYGVQAPHRTVIVDSEIRENGILHKRSPGLWSFSLFRIQKRITFKETGGVFVGWRSADASSTLLNAVESRYSSRNVVTFFFLNTRRWVMFTRYCNLKRWSAGISEGHMVGFIFSLRRFYLEEALWWGGLGIA